MLPNQLNAGEFRGYPPEARRVAIGHLELLRELPLGFVPLLLRELIVYDWRFPAERRELDAQFAYLTSLRGEPLRQLMAPFEALRLTDELQRLDWAGSPAQFSERLTAHLWATHQIDRFRIAAVEYVGKIHTAMPKEPPPAPRLGIVVIGHGVTENRYPLFRRLRPHGVYFRQVLPRDGWQILRHAVATRAAAHPVSYGHWYIDGGAEDSTPGSVSVSWNSLGPVRAMLLERVRKAMQSGTGSEALRTMLAQMDPRDLGLGGTVLERFQVSLLTEGSGTQIYSTTFVQWAAREALRRAQPMTLLARFAPRVRELSLGELVSNPRQQPPPDPQGALIDADMGAYYTWLSQQRLSAAEQARFLVWFEDHGEALGIAPSLGPGSVCEDRIDMRELLNRLIVA
jgi:hypothetical protein